jgi:hypothetical protein
MGLQIGHVAVEIVTGGFENLEIGSRRIRGPDPSQKVAHCQAVSGQSFGANSGALTRLGGQIYREQIQQGGFVTLVCGPDGFPVTLFRIVPMAQRY